MAKNKTTETESSVADFINSVADETKRADSFRIAELMEQQTGLPAKMWGPAIVGFGTYHYKYDSGHEGDAPLVAFSPRANAISLYLYPEFATKETLLQKFGKHKAGKSCIYVKRLADIDIEILKRLITDSLADMKVRHGQTSL